MLRGYDLVTLHVDFIFLVMHSMVEFWFKEARSIFSSTFGSEKEGSYQIDINLNKQFNSFREIFEQPSG